MAVRAAVKPNALKRRRCVRNWTIAAFSLAAEKATRDLDETMAVLDSINAARSISVDRAGAALEDLDLAEKDMRVFDSRQIEGAVNDVSRQQYASALRKLETGVKNYWLELCTKRGKTMCLY